MRAQAIESLKDIDSSLMELQIASPQRGSIVLSNAENIIRQVADGLMLKDIGAQYGIKPATISDQLSKYPVYQRARMIGAEMRLEKNYGEIESAEDALDVTRARESFRAASWLAEREFPERWGNKASQTVVNVQQNNVQVAPDDRDARIAELLARAGK